MPSGDRPRGLLRVHLEDRNLILVHADWLRVVHAAGNFEVQAANVAFDNLVHSRHVQALRMVCFAKGRRNRLAALKVSIRGNHEENSLIATHEGPYLVEVCAGRCLPEARHRQFCYVHLFGAVRGRNGKAWLHWGPLELPRLNHLRISCYCSCCCSYCCCCSCYYDGRSRHD